MNAITEEEAATKVCPNVKSTMVFDSNNRITIFPPCGGSQCMAWRWLKGSETASVRRGYCGLAGRP